VGEMSKRKNFTGQYAVIYMFLILTILSMGYGVVDQVLKVREYKKEMNSLRSQISKVDEDIKELEENKKYINKDEYIEKIAREKLSMVKPEEIIYIDINKKE
jgi:cell division protein DivIC